MSLRLKLENDISRGHCRLYQGFKTMVFSQLNQAMIDSQHLTMSTRHDNILSTFFLFYFPSSIEVSLIFYVIRVSLIIDIIPTGVFG